MLISEVSMLLLLMKWNRGITTDSMNIKSIIKEYYEQFYAHKLDNLDKKWNNSLKETMYHNSHMNRQSD